MSSKSRFNNSAIVIENAITGIENIIIFLGLNLAVLFCKLQNALATANPTRPATT